MRAASEAVIKEAGALRVHINAPVIAVVAKFMTASAVAVNAPARNEKENTSQAPALSEVQSSRRVGGSPAKESPARHVSRPPAQGCPVYKESAGAAAGPGRKQGSWAPTAPEPGDVSPLRALRATEGPARHGAVAAVGPLKPATEPPQGATRSPRLGPGLGCSPAGLGSRGAGAAFGGAFCGLLFI